MHLYISSLPAGSTSLALRVRLTCFVAHSAWLDRPITLLTFQAAVPLDTRLGYEHGTRGGLNVRVGEANVTFMKCRSILPDSNREHELLLHAFTYVASYNSKGNYFDTTGNISK